MIFHDKNYESFTIFEILQKKRVGFSFPSLFFYEVHFYW